MNANELADELVIASSEMEYNHIVDDWKLLSDAAIMLRHQANEIIKLKLEWQYMAQKLEEYNLIYGVK